MHHRELLSLIALGLLATGCIDATGGAVEARWDLRDRLGVRISCSEAGLTYIDFSLEPLAGGEDPCETGVRCRFPCEDSKGTTDFGIPPGTYAMALHGVGEDEQRLTVAGGVVAPAPVVREVTQGQLTDLSVNLIIVSR